MNPSSFLKGKIKIRPHTHMNKVTILRNNENGNNYKITYTIINKVVAATGIIVYKR